MTLGDGGRAGPRPEGPLCAWVGTEGMDVSPIICAPAADALGLVEQLGAAKLIHTGAVTPCCRAFDDDQACTWDIFDPIEDDLERQTEVLRITARGVGIDWPASVEPQATEGS